MKLLISIALIILALAGQAAAEPVKCVSAGKTIYTDDPSRCGKSDLKPIGGSLTISTLPNQLAGKKAAPASSGGLPALTGGMPLPEGVSSEDVAAGWQTIMDARKRGSWQAPVLPDYAK